MLSILVSLRCGLVAAVTLALLAGHAGATNWNYLDGPFGGQPDALTIDAAGNTWAAMNGAGVYVRASGTSRWLLRPGLPTQGNAAIRVDSRGAAFAAGSSGLYVLGPGATTWDNLAGTNGLPPTSFSALFIDVDDTLYAASGNGAVYRGKGADAAWTAVGTPLPGSPSAIVKDRAGNLWASVPGFAVYKLAPGAADWTAVGSGVTSAPINSLIVVGPDLFAGIQFGGVAKLANAAGGGTTWVPWTGGALAVQDAVYALAASATGTIYAAGLGRVLATTAASTSWVTVGSGLQGNGPSYSIVWSDGEQRLTLGNGSGIHTLDAGQSQWQQGNDGMAASTVYGLAATSGGTLYAATFGQGVQRQAAGTRTWEAVDASRIGVTAEAIVVDTQGTVFAVAGGEVKKLVADAWQTAGSGQSEFARSLVVDAAGAIVAGTAGGVQKLAPGASNWTTLGTGLPAGENIYALAIDGSGAIFAGIFGNGIWSLPAGDTAWSKADAGLPDASIRVLQRDPAGAMHAGMGDGVYRNAGGTWTKVGANALEAVTALAFDTNGDAYAAVANQRVHRLPAGTATWLPVPAGLESRGVTTLLAANGRVYGGTEAGRGSRSGAYALWTGDSVVEFYNTLLDNFFITASAAEQAAIQDGSAGPGWILTGGAFSAGGPSLVCRFYGSIVPGPNSHFYTIDPAECQQLKDIQASTPASEKRWNFESNDFASLKPTDGACPAGTLAVYRAYNNGFARGVDSNHRITAIEPAYLAQVAHGWLPEGIVLCAPR